MKASHPFWMVLAWAALDGLSLSYGQPANDLFAYRAPLSGSHATASANSVGATREPGEPYHAGNRGGASLWWTWTAPFSGFVAISTAGSSIDTVLGIYSGTSVASLTWVASNDDENYDWDIYTSFAYFDVVAQATYEIAVDGYAGESGPVELHLDLEPFPPAPAWSLPDPAGTLLHSTNFAGQVILLDFWATWCGPCKAELPDLVSLQNQYGGDGLVIIGASIDATAQAVTTFMATNAIRPNYPILMSTFAFEEAYAGIDAVPTTFVIDRHNFVRKRFVGVQPRSTFEKALIPLLYGETRVRPARSEGELVLRWPTQAQSFTLEFAADLTNAAWTSWPTLPTVVDGTNTVTIPTADAPNYFRLRMPY